MIVVASAGPFQEISVAIGPESDEWIDAHGFIVKDITPILAALRPDVRTVLKLTMTSSETDMVEAMAAGRLSGSPPGLVAFSAPTSAGFGFPPAPPPPVAAGREDAPRCAYCGRRGEKLVPDLNPPICYDCVKIEMGLKNARQDNAPGQPGVDPAQ